MKARQYTIVTDPVYYVVVAFFALLSTALPVALGQRWLLPIGQTIALFALLFVAWRKGTAIDAVRVLALWLVIQAATFFGVAYFVGGERVIADGFAYGQALLEWIFGVGPLPDSLTQEPLWRAVELFGVTVGTTISAGLMGVWFLVNSVNRYAFGLATAYSATGSIWGLVAAIEPWWLLRLCAWVGLVATFALPGYTGKWSPAQWLPAERRLFYVSLALLVVALALELMLPTAWAAFANARIMSPGG